MQKTTKYPAGLPSKPMNCIAVSSAYTNSQPANHCRIIEPTPPAMPPMPVTVAIADLGNMSPMVEKILADHDWCAAPPRPIRMIANRGELKPMDSASSTSTGRADKISMARIRAA